MVRYGNGAPHVLPNGTEARAVVARLRIVDEQSGAIAQLGERLPCTQEVAGSTPVGSTSTGACRIEHQGG